MTRRKSVLMWRLVLPVAIAILPLTLAAQNAARTPDESLKAESYQTPPRELADAVLAPRYLNVTLTNASPDEKWVAAANTAPTNTTTTPDDTAPQAPAATAGGRNSQGGAQAPARKDRVYQWLPPFDATNAKVIYENMYYNLGDQNVGTDPTNSIRLYHALNGLGKTTALYLCPLEDHGPVARETLLDLGRGGAPGWRST